ncbi:hypothetical protein [uncultured Polaribacter sp.]|uniref:hypothetical protein n=1 Tax=uncultured Polaribacter sp. TaxID=174711 RepID=UPI002632D0AB|nr:hypothetical protein [uncultured Polaribacter sp.]
MKFNLFLAVLLLIKLQLFGQLTAEIKQDSSLNGQFNNIYKTSTTYQRYKVINKEKYLQLKQNVLDSIKTSKKIILEKENLLSIEKENIKKTKTILAETQKALAESNLKEDNISLFGIQLSKVSYNLILWSIILLLFSGFCIFISKFSRSKILTKEAKENLEHVTNEFEEHRKKSLKREQKLRRQLQDEINKQRNG